MHVSTSSVALRAMIQLALSAANLIATMFVESLCALTLIEHPLRPKEHP